MLTRHPRRLGVAALAVGMPMMLLPSPAPPTATIASAFAEPVTPTHTAVGVQVRGAAVGSRVVVNDASGRAVGSARVAGDERAVVPIRLSFNESRHLTVRVGDTGARVRVIARHRGDTVSGPWVVVNKHHGIGRSVPARLIARGGVLLAPAAMRAYQAMVGAAARDGIRLWAASSYRSYSAQQGVFDGYVRTEGRAVAQSASARPGFSEHQTGLAVDVASDRCTVQACFAGTAAGRWVARHAGEFGFVVRYPKGRRPATGYRFEPWHLRYVGSWLAGYLSCAKASTLEQVLGLPGAPTYRR